MLRKLKEATHAVVDIGVVLMVGIAFAGLMVGAYIIYTLFSQLNPESTATSRTAIQNQTWNTSTVVTEGFGDAVSLILVAITIFILAIAISALLMLRGR
jgi:large-conductance mechanosensitive channel